MHTITEAAYFPELCGASSFGEILLNVDWWDGIDGLENQQKIGWERLVLECIISWDIA